jgi:hypothetical protein
MPIHGVDHVGIAVEHADPPAQQFGSMLGCQVVHDEALAIGARAVHLAVGHLDAVVSIPGEDAVIRFRGGKGRAACFLSQHPGGALIELLGERA